MRNLRERNATINKVLAAHEQNRGRTSGGKRGRYDFDRVCFLLSREREREEKKKKKKRGRDGMDVNK